MAPEPSPMSGTMIDDVDPAVRYSGNWAAYSGSSTSYRGTTHESSSLNDRATLAFQGIGVLVNSGQQGIGWRVRSSYTIDGGSPSVYSNVSYQSTRDAYRSPTLPDGQHTLTVINLDNRGVPLFLDSFLIITPDDTVSTSAPSTTLVSASTSTSSNSTVSNSTTNSGFLTPTRSPALSSKPSPSSRNPGQVLLVAGPISGAILICGVIIIYLLIRRRRKQKEPDTLISPASSNNLVQFPLNTAWVNGQNPSFFMHDTSEPPPYIQDGLQDPRHASYLSTPHPQPAKFHAR